MLYFSFALFLLALVGGFFGFAVSADPTFAHMAQLAAASLLAGSFLLFLVDRAWGAYVLRRQARRAALSRSMPRLNRDDFATDPHMPTFR